MVASVIKSKVVHNAAKTAPTLAFGEIALNTANGKVYVGPSGGGTGVELLAIRPHSSTATYADGDLVVHSGVIYRAVGALTAHVFDPDEWESGTGGILEPGNSGLYVRKGDIGAEEWIAASPENLGAVEEAAINTTAYFRRNNTWIAADGTLINYDGGTVSATLTSILATLDTVIEEAPSNGSSYVRKDAGWVVMPASGVEEAPIDGTQYGRVDGDWAPLPGGGAVFVEEAPNDGEIYVRRNTDWEILADLDATLVALGAVTTAANKLIYASGVDTFLTTDFTSQARQLLDDTSFGAMLTTLGAQPLDASLTAFAALATAANKGIHFSGVDTPVVHDLTAFALTILDDTDASTMRGTLGLGTAAVLNTGVASGNIPILDGSGNLVKAIMPDIYDNIRVDAAAGTAALIQMRGDAGYSKTTGYYTSSTPRWFSGSNGTAEGGSNAGSDFIVDRYNDAGSYAGTALTIRRSTGEMLIETGLVPDADGGAYLGVNTLGWSGLKLAADAIIGWANLGCTITHDNANDAVSFGGAAGGWRFTTPAVPATDDGVALGSASFRWSDVFLGPGAVINIGSGDVTLTHSTDLLAFAGASNGYTFSHAILPAANDGAALGASGTAWSDLFLAPTGVVNFGAGDVLITHSTNTLAFTGASLGYTFDVRPTFNGNTPWDGGNLAQPATLNTASQAVTGGAAVTSYSHGNKSSGTFTVDPSLCPMQNYVNTGAHTLAGPASGGGSCIMSIVNGSGAGVITLSTFHGSPSVDGDAFDTTVGSVFRCYISRDSVSAYNHISVKKLN